jgi:exosortase
VTLRLLDASIVLLIVVVFYPAVTEIAAAWTSVDYLAYGAVVAPLCAWLAWWKRPVLARLPAERDVAGGAALAIAFSSFAFGFLSDLLFFQGLGLVGAIAGAVWLLRGRAWLRELAFPIGYLLFVVPPPPSAIAPLTNGLRLGLTEVALGVLHLFDLPVARDGNEILLPRDTLFVADACTGISSIFTLIPAAVLMAYFTQPQRWGRAALIASVLPIALFWNFVRVIATVLGSLEYGAEQVAGPLHEAAGLLTFSLGCLTLLGVDAGLRRWTVPGPPTPPRDQRSRA